MLAVATIELPSFNLPVVATAADSETTDVNPAKGTVKATACVDTKNLKLRESNGEEAPSENNDDFPLKALTSYTVIHDEAENSWLVNKFDSTGDKKC